jgi:hypothetical protein
MSLDVNFVAVLAASVAAYVIGALWYTVLFGKQWMSLMGITEEMRKNPLPGRLSMGQSMTGGFVATVVMVFVLANFLPVGSALTVGIALNRAFLVWLGFIATLQLNGIFYEGRPFKLYIINAAHYLVAILVAAAVFAWWPW